ncbi:MAG: hypothetical protein ACYSUI_18180 [Planctomycetota bacterium]|jgi:hypothetical protein
MQIRRASLLGVAVVAFCGVVALAVQREERQPAKEPVYKVTTWPANTAERAYHEHLERYLNEMASQGWRLHSPLAGQGSKMMVFERRAQE